jgi:hypothetical protein
MTTSVGGTPYLGAGGKLVHVDLDARARERGLLGAGSLVALYAQGAGFTRAAAVLQVE